MVLRDFCQKIKTSRRRWPGYYGIAHSAISAGASTAAEAPTAADQAPAPGPSVQEAQEAQHQNQEQQGDYKLPCLVLSVFV